MPDRHCSIGSPLANGAGGRQDCRAVVQQLVGRSSPVQQAFLIGMGGQAAHRVDDGLEADDHEVRLLTLDVVLEMPFFARTGACAAPGDDDRS